MSADFDLESDSQRLHDKYLVERDKRLRPEGNAQYIPVDDKFARFGDDPHVEPGFSRDPIFEDVEVALIGGGHAGLLAGHALREAGIDDFRIIEKAGDFGGTWY